VNGAADHSTVAQSTPSVESEALHQTLSRPWHRERPHGSDTGTAALPRGMAQETSVALHGVGHPSPGRPGAAPRRLTVREALAAFDDTSRPDLQRLPAGHDVCQSAWPARCTCPLGVARRHNELQPPCVILMSSGVRLWRRSRWIRACRAALWGHCSNGSKDTQASFENEHATGSPGREMADRRRQNGNMALIVLTAGFD
jgi:hypothetical protein